MRVTSKSITLSVAGQEASFRLRLMDAFTGAWLLKLLLEKLLPFLSSSDPETIEKELAEHLPALLSSLSEQDLRELMTRCLNHVDRMLPSGPQPVMLRSSFGIPELEQDTVTCLSLCLEEIFFNLEGFFPESVSPSEKVP